MDVDTQPTFLRIKRRRDEDSVDALVINQRGKKAKTAEVDIFQFAQTVDDVTWDEEAIKLALQDQIAQRTPDAMVPKTTTTTTTTTTTAPSPSVTRTYTVVPQDRDREALTGRSFIDAVPTTNPIVDPEMEKIQDLLNNYLSMEQPDLKKSGEDDYVWDVFIRRPGTVDSLPAGAAVGTLLDMPSSFVYSSDSDFEPEDEADEDSNAEDNYKNDYPDEDDDGFDSSSSDEFHEDSEDDRFAYEDDEDEGHDWR